MVKTPIAIRHALSNFLLKQPEFLIYENTLKIKIAKLIFVDKGITNPGAMNQLILHHIHIEDN